MGGIEQILLIISQTVLENQSAIKPPVLEQGLFRIFRQVA
jgi:hypothetical protein